jgi:hypothetical protein
LMFSMTRWYGSTGEHDRHLLDSVVRTLFRIIGCDLPSSFFFPEDVKFMSDMLRLYSVLLKIAVLIDLVIFLITVKIMATTCCHYLYIWLKTVLNF